MKPALAWNTVKYIDCLDPTEGLPSLPDQSVDLCLTDPPYNLGYDGSLQSDPKKNKGVRMNCYEHHVFYIDRIADYERFSRSWFKEVMRVCKTLIFTPGLNILNLQMWLNISPPEGLFVHYKKNCSSVTSLSRFSHFEPILLYGKFRHQFDFQSNVFNIPLMSGGFLKNNQAEKDTMIHSSPKEFRLYYAIISRLRPKSVLDPFLGSGTTAAVCQRLGIPWLGYEIEPRYAQDINYRLARAKPQKKLKQEVLIK